MDKLNKFYDRYASANISLDDYFRRYSESLERYAHTKLETAESNENIYRLMDIDIPQARKRLMTHYCSIDNLTLPMEATNAEEREKRGYIDIPERILQDTKLKTIKVLKTLSKDVFLKSKSQDGIPIKYDDTELSNEEATVTPYKDFLLYVKVYEPFKSTYDRYRTTNVNPPFLKLKNVTSILGRQTLYELRRKIPCQSDMSIATEVSENPDQRLGPMARDVYKSGFFYIGDTFYNDTGTPNNVDYSVVIRKWAETRDIGPFKVATMDTRIESLSVKFGFPWLYQHQGCCEHIIVLTDARLITEMDVLALSAYPRIERTRPKVGKNCTMCAMLNVRWILTNHDRIPHDISYFCDKCFVSYNYIDGKKTGHFKAYNYPCITKLMPERRKIKRKQKRSNNSSSDDDNDA